MMEQSTAQQFSKQQYLRSTRYSGAQKDVLNVILQEDEWYSFDQIDQLFEQFMMREVL